jgi:hypothetical protein
MDEMTPDWLSLGIPADRRPIWIGVGASGHCQIPESPLCVV